jgi:3-dehydroquinate synthase
MPSPIHIEVPSRHGAYPVHVGAGLARETGRLLDDRALPARRIVVTNARVWRLHGKALAKVQGRREPILLPDGERHKTLASVARIYDALVRAGADRATTLVAFGGGVVGDTAGFAAATYLRGVPLVQVPSTLLAQVDASIGGKVGVNLAAGKNLVGAFYPPALVVTDPLLLETLPRREFRSGLYEVVKYGVIASRDLFDRVVGSLTGVFAREPAALDPIVAESCRINFGHTVGHALEAMTRYRRFLHGEAVALGMLAAAELGVARGLLHEDERTRLARAVAQMGPLPALADLSAAAALDIVRRDKKVVAGRLHVVLPTRIGEVTIVDDVKEKELERALRASGMRA